MIWPITLVLMIAFGALVLSGAFSAFPPVIVLVLALVVFGTLALFVTLRIRRSTGQISYLPLIWAVTIVALAGSYSYKEQGRLFALSFLEQPVVSVDPQADLLEVTLSRAWDGHYRAVAQIENGPVGLLVDTGASLVLLRYDDAERIGLDLNTLNFTVPVTTASGRSFVAPIEFERIKIGGIEVHGIKGAVAQPDQLHTSLLGMSFLESLYETTIRRDRMILRNPRPEN
ncbi:MAG: TIGR02281 family clan AA aspartic protease [Pseudomonadota bacterium]